MRDDSSWVEPVLSEDKCVLLKDHNAVTPVRLEPAALRSRVKHSTTEPLRSHRPFDILWLCVCSVSLTHDAVDWAAVCDRRISWLYAFTFACILVYTWLSILGTKFTQLTSMCSPQ